MKDKVAPVRRIAIMKEAYEGLQTLVSQPVSTKKIVTKHLVSELKERKTKAITKAVSKIQEAFHKMAVTKTALVSTAFKNYTLKITFEATHVGKYVGYKDNKEMVKGQKPTKGQDLLQLTAVLRKMFYSIISKVDNQSKYKVICWMKMLRKGKKEDEAKVDVYLGKYVLEPMGAVAMYKLFLPFAIAKLMPFIHSYDGWDMKAEFLFAKVVSGAGGTNATESREKSSIYKKKSVNVIKNDDKSCFWHALAVSLNKKHPKYSDIQKGRNIRTTLAKELCEKCGMKWDTEVALYEIEQIEQCLELNIYVLDIEEISILKATLNIYDS